MVNQYCAHSFARNWQLPFLYQRKGENDRRQYFMINLHERMLPTSAGVEPATSWSPVGWHIQLRNGMGKSIFLWIAPIHGRGVGGWGVVVVVGEGGVCLYNVDNQYTEQPSARNLWLPILKQWKERMCFRINRSMWGSNARSWPSEINASVYVALLVFFFFFGMMLVVSK